MRDDLHDEGGGEQQAGHDPGDEQVADRLLGEQAVDDEQQARRDQHAEHRAAGDDADREARRVAGRSISGTAILVKTAADAIEMPVHGGEDRVGGDGRDAEPALDAPRAARWRRRTCRAR